MKITHPDKLEFFRELYESAKAATSAEYDAMTRHFMQYKGSKDIDSDGDKPALPATYVRNITYELIESQVTCYIPTPSVSPQVWSEKNERNAKSIETMLKNLRDKLAFEEQNDIDERYSPIYGGSVWLVEWDESEHTHNTVGAAKVTCIPPNRFVGQPFMYTVQEMEYCFVTFETTKDELVRRYGVSEDRLDEAYTEEGDGEETATLYVCYYKDDDGNVCEYAWSGEVELLDLEDYYARKRYVCRTCKKRKEICNCNESGKKPVYELENDEFEELDRDIQLSDGTILPAMSPVIEDGVVKTEKHVTDALDENGNVVFDQVAGIMLPKEFTIEVPVTEKTRIPYYKPSLLPIVIRKNTSAEKKLFGQSDCEFIRPQQQAINKIESRIMEKLIGGGVFPILPDDSTLDVDNSIWKVALRSTPENFARFGRLELVADISKDVAMADRLYDQAKRILGISDSFQGQADTTAKSGVAKQLQIQQSAGRQMSKRQLKNAAYADMDRILFQFHLAYADEPRAATYLDAYGRTNNSTFSRYDFLERDEAGNYYYNDEFLFSADASTDTDNDREFLWQETRANYQMGAYGDPSLPQTRLVYWLNLEKAHYPNARENVTRIQEEIAQQQQMMMLAKQAEMASAENVALKEEIENRKGYESYLVDQQRRQAVNG